MSNEKPQNKGLELRAQLEKRLPEFTDVLPKHITAEKFVGIIMRATLANQDLLEADRISFFEAALAAAIDGLKPDGKEGAMVIYNTKIRISGKDEWIKKVQWLPMIRGIFTKLYNTGKVKSCSVGAVYAEDEFDAWTDETGEHLHHRPRPHAKNEQPIRYYAMVITRDQGVFVETMWPDEIDKIRAASKSKDSGPWVTWFDEMAKKSVFKRLAKRLPMASEISEVLSRDDYLYEGENARDITPAADRPRGLSNRLAALADMSGVADPIPTDTVRREEVREELARETQEQKREADTPPSPKDAFKDGQSAADKGMSRKAIPAKYRDDQKLAEAWQSGFDKQQGERP